MADKKISELPELTTANDSIEFPVNDGGVTKKITKVNLGAISDIVEDTTPQLGGNLDLNGNTITGLVIGTDVQAYDADLATVASSGIGTSANQMVRLDGSAKLPAVDGSNLTSLTSGNLTGALPAISGASLTNLPGGATGAITSLWNGSVSNAEITLSADIDDYHYLAFLWGTRFLVHTIPIPAFKDNTYGDGTNGHLLAGYSSDHLWVKWTSDTTIDVNEGASSQPLLRVWGVK